MSTEVSFDIIILFGGIGIAGRYYVTNESIRAREVRVIDFDGSQAGVLPIREAVDRARQNGYDLILISPDANPPVCRIADLGKIKYEAQKKEKQTRKTSKAGQVKEVKMGPKIGEHDFVVKAERTQEFLKKGYKVKVTLHFRGREATHPEIGRNLLRKMAEAVVTTGAPEGNFKQEGRNIIMMMSPK